MAKTMPMAPVEPVASQDVNIKCAGCDATAWAERPERIAAHDCQTGDWFVFVMPGAVAA